MLLVAGAAQYPRGSLVVGVAMHLQRALSRSHSEPCPAFVHAYLALLAGLARAAAAELARSPPPLETAGGGWSGCVAPPRAP